LRAARLFDVSVVFTVERSQVFDLAFYLLKRAVEL
jgi:hypothetical protein